MRTQPVRAELKQVVLNLLALLIQKKMRTQQCAQSYKGARCCVRIFVVFIFLDLSTSKASVHIHTHKCGRSSATKGRAAASVFFLYFFCWTLVLVKPVYIYTHTNADAAVLKRGALLRPYFFFLDSSTSKASKYIRTKKCAQKP